VGSGRQLYAYHGDVPVEVRRLKLTEEVGEVADAFIGMHGLNRRKGVCRTRDDLLAELADVIITAAIAMGGVTGDATPFSAAIARAASTRDRARCSLLSADPARWNDCAGTHPR
jgi:NTP pyrophosphatase (non-canonical NTP hydrolase)